MAGRSASRVFSTLICACNSCFAKSVIANGRPFSKIVNSGFEESTASLSSDCDRAFFTIVKNNTGQCEGEVGYVLTGCHTVRYTDGAVGRSCQAAGSVLPYRSYEPSEA